MQVPWHHVQQLSLGPELAGAGVQGCPRHHVQQLPLGPELAGVGVRDEQPGGVY